MARGPRLTCHTPPTAFHPIKPSYPFPCSMLVHLWMYITLNVLNVKIAPKLSSIRLLEIRRPCNVSGYSSYSETRTDPLRFYIGLFPVFIFIYIYIYIFVIGSMISNFQNFRLYIRHMSGIFFDIIDSIMPILQNYEIVQ